MFVPCKVTVKLANRKMGHAQEIGIISCLFPKFSIICPVGPVYYCPGYTSNTISSGAPKLYVDFQKITYEPLEYCNFDDPQGRSWRSPCQTQKNIDYLQMKIVKVKPQRNMNIVVLTVCSLSENFLSQLIHQ